MKQAMSVMVSEATVEWYTPAWLIDIAREVLGGIDLDPASSELPQTWIKAERFFTKESDALQRLWHGRVWLNPPFENTAPFVDYLEWEFEQGRVTEALLLINSNLGYKWYEDLWIKYPVCMLRDRVKFVNEFGVVAKAAAKRAQTVVLLHRREETLLSFKRLFEPLGRIIMPS